VLSFQGQAFNIEKPILAKVTREKKGILVRKNYIYVTENPDKAAQFYVGIISLKQRKEVYKTARTPGVFGLLPEELLQLRESDIVVLEPNGRVNVLWDAGSEHNSIFATGKCNCSCVMCPQPSTKDPDWLTKFNLRLIELVDPDKTHNIGITGGEPTLLGQGLIKLIEVCKKRLPNTSLSLLTNGKRFSNLDFVKHLVGVDHSDLTICIPLYADNDTEHDRIVGVKGSFYETLKGIKNLALFRQKIEIRNVIHSLTYKRLPQFVEFIYHNFPFVLHIALMGMETTGLALKNLKTLWIDPVDYMPELRFAVKYLQQREMNVSIYNLQLCIIPQELWLFARKSISEWKNIYVKECENCDFMKYCSGFFGTSGDWHSKHIRALKNEASASVVLSNSLE